MEKKKWRLWRRTVFSRDTCWWPPRHHYLSKPGGGGEGGGGGLGGVAYKDRARPPPRGWIVTVLAIFGIQLSNPVCHPSGSFPASKDSCASVHVWGLNSD